MMAPPTKPPMTATTTWMTIGKWTAKPIQPAIMAPPMNWPVAPMLNMPARKASATARPARMSGVALTVVSDRGLKIAAVEPPWKAADIVCGLMMAPSNIAE